MKQKTQKGYVAEKLNMYLKTYKNSSLRYKFLYKKSRKDERLAELVYVYYKLNNDSRYKEFEKMLDYEVTKYDEEYKLYLESLNRYKLVYKKKVESYLDKNGMTYYKLSKLANTNQSNVSQFFKKNNLDALSEKKLKHLVRKLRVEAVLSKNMRKKQA